jgi:N-glycosylase/DNA lyase
MLKGIRSHLFFIFVVLSPKYDRIAVFCSASFRRLIYQYNLHTGNKSFFRHQLVMKASTQTQHIKIEIKQEKVRQNSDWIDLQIPPEELRPNLTLRMGQCFNWRKLVDKSAISSPSTKEDEGSVWIGVLEAGAIGVRQTSSSTEFLPLAVSSTKQEHMVAYLQDYFELKHNLRDLYEHWSSACPRMKIVCSHLPGVRVVRQDPWECLVSFICSSCNNIKRITQMLESLRTNYGNYLCSVMYKDGQLLTTSERSASLKESADSSANLNAMDLYSFPGPEVIASIAEEELRGLGFGE